MNSGFNLWLDRLLAFLTSVRKNLNSFETHNALLRGFDLSLQFCQTPIARNQEHRELKFRQSSELTARGDPIEA